MSKKISSKKSGPAKRRKCGRAPTVAELRREMHYVQTQLDASARETATNLRNVKKIHTALRKQVAKKLTSYNVDKMADLAMELQSCLYSVDEAKFFDREDREELKAIEREIAAAERAAR